MIITLHGALRDAEPTGRIELQQAFGSLQQVRGAVQAHADAHWPPAARALVPLSAFATFDAVLRDDDPLPAVSELALLPPVSGG